MLYLLILKDAERESGGLTDRQVLKITDITGSKTFTKDDIQNTSFAFDLDAIACYEDSKVYRPNQVGLREKLVESLPTERRVFRHFGGTNMTQLDSHDKIVRKMRSDFSNWSETLVVPYTDQGGDNIRYPWLNLVQEVRDDFLNPSNGKLSYEQAVEKLGIAWRRAEHFYFLEQAVLKMLQACFPLYLALLNDCGESDINAEREAVSADTDFAKNVDSIAQNSSRFEGLSGWTNPSELLNNKMKFGSEFRKLSQFCTEILKIALDPLPPTSKGDAQ